MVGGAAAAAGAGTSALFFDDASTDNDVSAGTLSLGSASGQFTVSDLFPGDQTAQQRITATYSGSQQAELDLDVSVSDLGGDAGDRGGTEFAQNLQLDVAELSTANQGTLTDFTGSYSTLAGLAGAAPFDSQTQSLADGDTVNFDLQLTLASGTSNDFQGEGAAIGVTFTAEQPERD